MRKLLPKRRNRKRATKSRQRPPVPQQRQLARMPKRLQAARPPLKVLPLRRLQQRKLRLALKLLRVKVVLPRAQRLMELQKLPLPELLPMTQRSNLLMSQRRLRKLLRRLRRIKRK